MSEGARVLYEVDGKFMADIRSAQELVDCIELFPGWIVVEKVKLSEATRGGIILPNADTKDQQHLMLFRVASSGPPKIIRMPDGTDQPREIFASVGDMVILKPAVAQFLVNQNHQFGVIADVDIIGKVNISLADGVKAVQQTDPVAVPNDIPEVE